MFEASNIFSVALKLKATIPVFLLPEIVASFVQNFICVPSLSSPLLLRNYPNTFAFIPIPPMSLSSRNRSIFNTFHYILPCVTPVCEGMHYHKTGVPWQMKRIFIIFLYLLISCQILVFYCICQLISKFSFSYIFSQFLIFTMCVWYKKWYIFLEFGTP